MPHALPLALILVLLATGVLHAEDPSPPPARITTFGDEVDPDSDCDVTEADGMTTITVPGTWHDLTHTDTYDRLNAPRLMNDAEGDFTLQVKIDPSDPPDGRASSGGVHTFLSTGVVIWQDEDNFIRMDRAAVPGSQFVWVERFEKGKSVSQDGAELNDPKKPIRFRVTRTGDTFTFEQSANGQDWTAVHELEAKLPARLQVGVHAINTTDKPHIVKLSEYELQP